MKNAHGLGKEKMNEVHSVYGHAALVDVQFTQINGSYYKISN